MNGDRARIEAGIAAQNYELTDEENEVVGQSSTRLRALTIVTVLQATGLVALGFYALAAACVVLAVVLGLAALSLKRVVTTTGNDVAHLMSTMRHLTWVFVIRFGIIGLIVIAAIVQLARVLPTVFA